MKLTTAERKKFRVRNKVKKVSRPGRFRLCISRSTKNISASAYWDENSNVAIVTEEGKIYSYGKTDK